jgi:DNA-binding transcriptional LysR family regulator
MEIRHLRYFVAVAELRNFTRAAERSFVAQSALSQQIGRLEREVGAPLFVRDNHSVELTPAGEVLLPHARRVIADVEAAQAELRSYLGLEKGSLRLGLIQTTANAIDVVGPIQRFHSAYPDIEIHIVNQTSAEMVAGVQNGSLDLAVVGLGGAELPPGVSHHRLAADPLVGVICAESAGKLKGPLTLKNLLKHGPLISFAAGTGIRKHVDEALQRAGIAPENAFELTQATDMLRFAALGLGVTVVPRALAEQAPPEIEQLGIGPYRVFELSDEDAVHPVTVVYDAARLSAAGQRFLGVLGGSVERPTADTAAAAHAAPEPEPAAAP